MDLQAFIKKHQTRINQYLDTVLPPSDAESTSLNQSMRYMVLGGGKRIRPLLVYASGHAFGADENDLDQIAAAVELIHIYSLVHDDLPAMDDDDLRHGHAACHIEFGEATAILCGDALQSLAFELLTGQFKKIDAKNQISAMQILTHAAGPYGMVKGQALDMAAEGKKVLQPALEEIHRHKTGALITACIKLGAVAGGMIDPDKMKHLEKFANTIGLVFQIHDDILDIESDTETLGKPQGADIEKEKSTYPALLGLEKAKALRQEYYDVAKAALAKLDEDTQYLRGLAEFIVSRNH